MRIILVSHGSFSKGLYQTMEMVLGPQENLSYVGLYPEQGVDILKENIEKEFKEAKENEEILVLTDLFYGSPFNAVVQLMNKYDVYHLTGINVPLLMEILIMRSNGKNAEEICEEAMKLAGSTVQDVRKYLADMMKMEEEDEECETSF
ncbi:MAG: PTS sugar transporter subunit IIA [Erysipelotrichaceae bacterium]|uniref:PTS sugar transporter subunit IIA n=1 Tax=Faecalicoccus pleomorphus TaxID=1323 RepID=A0A7X9RK98_9FIRM|nr:MULTISPECIES: PTS sugar transporter subunit IIA [Faecalicoccus]MBE6119634.1 PTS sugar transporter subunit IIA [Erysipelotrichaceae bacterium]MDY4870653.1 PTS sugar transporter subunit IIA [Faecalicoccus sp.]MDY5232579.1 PTS sugar transporter subunit IIA [Faecalicoccus sp.]NME45099.1 PTS sugar transporter subunit IIA [Faecalicoccus pleomorphus]